MYWLLEAKWSIKTREGLERMKGGLIEREHPFIIRLEVIKVCL